MKFTVEPEPVRHEAVRLASDLSRIVATNPSKMTYHGTNTYGLETAQGMVVIDPGPADAGHVADLVRLFGRDIVGIVLTHHHSDHSGATLALQAATGAPVAAFATFRSEAFRPDISLAEGDDYFGMEVLHTPGHASDHVCLATPDGRVFSGDHVMAWAPSVIPPPDGKMADNLESLARLADRSDWLYYPGHGPVLEQPQDYIRSLIAHRLRKETLILEQLSQGAKTTAELVDLLHNHGDPRLKRAAEITILAHLEKLSGEKRAVQADDLWLQIG